MTKNKLKTTIYICLIAAFVALIGIFVYSRIIHSVELVFSFDLDGKSNSNLAWSPDDMTLAVSNGTKLLLVSLYDTSNKPQLLSVAETNIHAIAFSPTGNTLAYTTDNDVVLWDIPSGKNSSIYNALNNGGNVAISPNGKILAVSNNNDRVIQLWDLPSKMPLPSLQGHTQDIGGIFFSPDGQTLVSYGCSMCKPAEFFLWDISSSKVKTDLKQEGIVQEDIQYAAFAPDGKSIFTVSGGCDIRLLDLNSGQTHTLNNSDQACLVTFSSDGSMVAIVNSSNKIDIWDTKSMILRHEIFAGGVYRMGYRLLNRIAFSPDGKAIAFMSDQQLQIWKQ